MTVYAGSRTAQFYRCYLRPALKRVRRWAHDQTDALMARRAASAGRLKPSTEAAALTSLRAPTPRQRWEGAMALGRHPQRSTEAIAALIEALADPEPFVRWKAAAALANQDVTCVFHALTDALIAGQPLQRAGAAEALGRIGGEAATNALCKQVGDASPDVRRALAHALGQISDPTTVVELTPLLQDDDVAVRCAAARALGQIANPGTAAPLAEALARPGQPLLVRRALAAALTRAHHPDAQPTLLTALSDPDPQVRGYAARALGHIGNEVAYEKLADLLADRHALLKGTVGDEAQAARTMLERRGRRAAPVSPAPARSDPA